jgi:hypothetical protein
MNCQYGCGVFGSLLRFPGATGARRLAGGVPERPRKVVDVGEAQPVGDFGGVEMNIMTLNTPDEVKTYVFNLLDRIGTGNGGIAIGTGNQISSYTEPANWIAMCEAVREWRDR